MNLSPDRKHTIVGSWLVVLCCMVFLMVVLGAVTRLTHSGLSMVQWRPVTGWLPPMGESAWQAAFEDYKQYPEYQKVNAGMTLDGYRSIFWLEYLHRLWGRLIGLVFAVPFLVFWRRGMLSRALVPKLLAMFVLGGLQGGLGWYMVKSGLVYVPDVSHLRLTAHLTLACGLYSYMLWVAFDLLAPRKTGVWALVPPAVRQLSAALAVVVPITVCSGGLVAGLNAGFVFNDFPYMAGQLLPDGMMALSPAWSNFVDNVITVQFQHRLLGLTVALTAWALWAVGRSWPLSAGVRRAVATLAGLVLVQVSLGIATLLLHVPTALAAAHQAVGVLVLTAVLWTHHELRRGVVQRAVRVGTPVPVHHDLGVHRASA